MGVFWCLETCDNRSVHVCTHPRPCPPRARLQRLQGLQRRDRRRRRRVPVAIRIKTRKADPSALSAGRRSAASGAGR